MPKTCNPNKNLIRSACSTPLTLCGRRPTAHLQPLPMGNRRGEIVIISRVVASSVGDHHCCGAKTLFLHLEDTLALIGNHRRFRLNRSLLVLERGWGVDPAFPWRSLLSPWQLSAVATAEFITAVASLPRAPQHGQLHQKPQSVHSNGFPSTYPNGFSEPCLKTICFN